MKTKAFSPSIQNVCKKLNESLQKLLDELYEYVGSVDKAASNVDPLAFLNDQVSIVINFISSSLIERQTKLVVFASS
jgi:hypothetical protein